MSAVLERPPQIEADDLSVALSTRLASLDTPALRAVFESQGEFLLVEDFLTPALTTQLVTAMQAARGALNRNYIPGHKKGGSVGRHALDRQSPFIPALYRMLALTSWLESLCGEKLLPSPENDPHAYALYFYTEPGDHIGWHYDTSYYKGARYTVLIGVVDDSSSQLAYRLYTRTPGREPVENSVSLKPGALVFFNGDKLQHKITPLGVGEERVSLTLEYVTDPRMSRWRRFVSNMKDSIAYFGFRQVFKRGARP